IEKMVDLGFVGEPEKIDTTVLTQILGSELIPVLAPLAAAAQGGTYNVNADTFAGAIAGALKAKRLLLLTDVPGVLDKSNKLIKPRKRPSRSAASCFEAHRSAIDLAAPTRSRVPPQHESARVRRGRSSISCQSPVSAAAILNKQSSNVSHACAARG